MATATATKTKANVAKFKIKSATNFISFLKRFSALPEKALILEITKDCIKAKSHTPDKATIKYSKMTLADVLEGDIPADVIKVPIYDINKVIGIFKHFGEADEVFFDLKYDNSGDECIGTEMKFHSNSLKITLEAGDMSLLTFVSSDIFKKIMSSTKDNSVISFPFKREYFSKINSLCGIDSATDSLHIKISDGSAIIKGKSFEYNIENVPPGSSVDFSFYNSHFSYIEQELSTFHVGPDRMLITSDESDTIIIIAKVEE